MNLVIIRVQSLVNNSRGNRGAFDPARVTKPGINYVGGKPARLSTGDGKGTGNDACTMDVTARVVGGAQDGKRGLNRLFASWCNNELDCPTSPGPGGHGEDVTHHFRKSVAVGAPPPPPPLIRTRCFWKLDGVWKSTARCWTAATCRAKALAVTPAPERCAQKWQLASKIESGRPIRCRRGAAVGQWRSTGLIDSFSRTYRCNGHASPFHVQSRLALRAHVLDEPEQRIRDRMTFPRAGSTCPYRRTRGGCGWRVLSMTHSPKP